ncbi:MerR family transcriptional regulator [Sulfuriroseicoccus oceanibius]|uniref:MerR family transcriptional regulator n=1 Tax=Sulfuriroseicoccus oceanibius TaxID=2707525 RepID=A0A6B3LAQ8_9BACT|nr:MerR family transcriptional regulator [Sulfuriroseicoccus oceanibius]QQL45996.1 MerR family transcriptional regulator [Sulfuriroseicoccus oceanibius]
MANSQYPMKYVTQVTGLSPHVLRVWERRYGAVKPQRTESNRRIYDEADVARLALLVKLTKAGHSIRHIANIPIEGLESMIRGLESDHAKVASLPQDPELKQSLLDKAWRHVIALQPAELQQVLDAAVVELGASGLIEKLLAPLIGRIGEGWENGDLSVAEEHAATAVIRDALFRASIPYSGEVGAPRMVVATPSGQLHELGAAMVFATARRKGWDVTYLGSSLPAEEIVRAVVRSEAIAVALSVVYPSDDPRLGEELRRLRSLLPSDVTILIGGRAAFAYRNEIGEIKASLMTDLQGLKRKLDVLRENRQR